MALSTASDVNLVMGELHRLAASSCYSEVLAKPNSFVEVVRAVSRTLSHVDSSPAPFSVGPGAPRAALDAILSREAVARAETAGGEEVLVPDALLRAAVARVRGVESDPSLAHMMEKFSVRDYAAQVLSPQTLWLETPHQWRSGLVLCVQVSGSSVGQCLDAR